MSGDAEVIRQFLVRLGFEVNETGSRKFDDTLGKTAKRAGTVAKSLIGVGLAAQTMVAVYASSMEKLYYASRRTGASVQNIQALEFGAQKIGLAAGEAQGALEGMAAAVRINPGLRGLMDQLLGKDTAKMDQAKAMIELVQRLSSMPHYVGSQFAGMFGVDEKTFLMLKQGMPELIKAEQERIDMNKRAGLDVEKAAQASVVYANSIRDLTGRISVLVGKLSVELLPMFLDLNEKIRDTIDAVQQLDFSKLQIPEASKEMKELSKAFSGFYETWKGLAQSEKGQNFFANWRTSLEGANNSLLQLITGLLYLASGEWSKGGSFILDGIKNGIKKSPMAMAGAEAFNRINEWRDSYRDKNAPASSYNGEAPAEKAARIAREKAAPPKPGWFDGWFKKDKPAAPAPAAPTAAPANLPRGIRNNNPGNLEFHDQPGATSDGRFAKFETPGGGLRALAAQLDRYNERGLNTISKIISTYAPAKKKDGTPENDTAAYIADVSKKMGVAPNAKLDLKDAEVLGKMMGAMIGKENGYNPYGETQLLSFAQERVGDGTVTIHQKTDIHVAPGATAAATGSEVGRVQDRVNGDIVRNLQGAIR